VARSDRPLLVVRRGGLSHLPPRLPPRARARARLRGRDAERGHRRAAGRVSLRLHGYGDGDGRRRRRARPRPRRRHRARRARRRERAHRSAGADRVTSGRRLALAAAAVAIAALRLATRPHAADSWDEVGFMRAVHDFDLAAFQPHFPGYPVYVALCKLVRVPALVSAAASAATALALWRLAGGGRAGGGRAGWIALLLWAGALGPWLSGGAALSDATAVAFAAAAFAALTWPGPRAALAGGV